MHRVNYSKCVLSVGYAHAFTGVIYGFAVYIRGSKSSNLEHVSTDCDLHRPTFCMMNKYPIRYFQFFQALYLCFVVVFLSGIFSPVVIICASSELRRATKDIISITFPCSSIFRNFSRWNKPMEVEGVQVETVSKPHQSNGEGKQKDTQGNTLHPVKTDIFTISSKLRTLEKPKSQSNNSDNGKWAVRRNTIDNNNTGTEDKTGSKSTELRLASMENQMDYSSMERLNSVLDIGKKRFVDYDPVNILEDFNTKSYDDTNEQKK